MIVHTSYTSELMRLYIIRNLRSLSIADLDFRQSNLGVGLLSLSDTLRDLSLDHVYNWDTLDLKSIGLHCRQLGSSQIFDSYSETEGTVCSRSSDDI